VSLTADIPLAIALCCELFLYETSLQQMFNFLDQKGQIGLSERKTRRRDAIVLYVRRDMFVMGVSGHHADTRIKPVRLILSC
jgi:hypothetical protein